MLIVCPSCATSYDVELQRLSASGRQVRCVRCRTVWHAEPSQAEKLLAAAAAIAPGHLGADASAAAEEPIADGGEGVAADRFADATPAGDAFAAEAGEVAAAARSDDSSDAEGGPEAVEAPPIAPVDLDEGQPPIDVAGDHSTEREPPEDVETVAARRQRRSTGSFVRGSLHWPLSRLQTGILALALIDVILVGWRSDVVRALPQTASFYALMGLPVNLRGLTFDDVATTAEQNEGVPILVVEGNIFNAARRSEDVPRLKFVVRNAARQEIYSWTAVPSRASLSPGEAVAFRSRLASPPPDAHDIVLRFVNRRDIVAGGR
jgi:predicted Zn finger-like uncharacterized protein